MPKVMIGRRAIGDGQPCFVIAEAGSNHNRSLEQAKALIRVAAEAGADAVKFQTFAAERMYPRQSGGVEYLKKLGVDRPIYEIIEEMEMPVDWIPLLADYCRDQGVLFLSTPFDEQSVDLLAPHVEAIKIASYELTHIPLIRHAAATGKALIVSTGAATIDEVADAVAAVREAGAPLCLTQCTARYPAPLESINVRAIDTMREAFGVPVGLSDHSVHPLFAPVAAVARGAAVLEKHFTLSRRLPGPDHSFALEPEELKQMVEAIRQVERALGAAEKALQPVEHELVNYRRSVYTARAVEADRRLAAADLVVLRRPGVAEEGIRPKHADRLVGRRARRTLPAQTLLKPDDVDPPLEA